MRDTIQITPALLSTILCTCAGPTGSAPASSTAAGPSWARDPDKSSDAGHTFTCQGEGQTEAEALETAHAICNDKICKLCGVEIESVVQTTETLTGVEMTSAQGHAMTSTTSPL